MSNELEQVARRATAAWMSHLGYTDKQIAYAELPTEHGEGCELIHGVGWSCLDENDVSLHPIHDEHLAVSELVMFALEHVATTTPQVVDSTCTCPSGDGSLRWPCPQHPPTPQVVETVEGRDAIPVGTVVRSASGTIGCRYDDHRGLVFGEDVAFEWSLLALPLTVLYPHPTPDVLAEVRACGAVWVCPEAEWSDNAYAGTWTCALPLSHGGPHVELTQGIRWQERGRRSDSIGEFYPPNATLDGEAGR